MSEASKQYVRTNDHGVIRVGGTRVVLDSVIVAWEDGDSPESIRSAFPSLSLEEVYGAITWVLAHRDEVAGYMKRQLKTYETLRQRNMAQPNPARDRIRVALRQARLLY
jgi:uncharacterized protein (DUF433 family)